MISWRRTEADTIDSGNGDRRVAVGRIVTDVGLIDTACQSEGAAVSVTVQTAPTAIPPITVSAEEDPAGTVNSTS